MHCSCIYQIFMNSLSATVTHNDALLCFHVVNNLYFELPDLFLRLLEQHRLKVLSLEVDRHSECVETWLQVLLLWHAVLCWLHLVVRNPPYSASHGRVTPACCHWHLTDAPWHHSHTNPGMWGSRLRSAFTWSPSLMEVVTPLISLREQVPKNENQWLVGWCRAQDGALRLTQKEEVGRNKSNRVRGKSGDTGEYGEGNWPYLQKN